MGIDIDALVRAAGFAAETPLTLAWIAGNATGEHVQGLWPDGSREEPVTALVDMVLNCLADDMSV